MYIQRLAVKNFKGFAERTFEFGPEFNLLVGENGSGKSSALQAVSLALAQVAYSLQAESFLQIHQVSLEARQIRRVRQNVAGVATFEPQFPSVLEWNGIFQGEPLVGKVHIPSVNAVGSVSPITVDVLPLHNQLTRLKSPPNAILPLIAFYRADRFENTVYSQPIQWQSLLTAKPQRIDGYFNCLAATSHGDSFVAWLAREQIISLQESIPTPLFSIVENAVCTCLPGAISLSFVVKEGEPVVRMEDSYGKPNDVLFSSLSDGQRSLLALVADMAIRSAQLNGHLGEDLLTKTPGVVLIDELDLHLHPRWQRRVVADLRRVFPKVQFIATTHSPQIIGETPPEQILVLTPDGVERVSQSYGLDSNEVLEQVMAAPSRNAEVERALAEIDRLIEADDLDAAKAQISRLRERQHGPTTATVRAQALVDQIEILADEMSPAE